MARKAVLLAIFAAALIGTTTAAKCCGTTEGWNGVCGEWKNENGCKTNDKCSWGVLCGNEMREVAQGLFLLIEYIGIVIFALCCEKARRWAAGMNMMWPATGNTNGQFRHSLFECCGCNSVCWRAACCELPVSSFNRAALDGRQWNWGELCCGLGPAVAWGNRQEIRKRLGVAPDPGTDCMTIWCCFPCAVGQHTLEIEQGFAANTAVPVGVPIKA